MLALQTHLPGALDLQPMAAEAGSDAQLWQARDPNGPVVIKLWPLDQADKAAAQATRQTTLAPLMAKGLYRVPEVLFFDATLCAMGMAHVPGDNALIQWQTTGDQQTLRAAAAWVAALHRTSQRRLPFRPAGHLSWLQRLLEQQAEGSRHIPDLPAFVAQVQTMQTLASAAHKRRATRAITHRDLHLSNLLIHNGQVWGLDFENAREDEPLRDIASLAFDALASAPEGCDRPGAMAALRAGYGDAHTHPAVRLFVQRAFALGIWARTPVQASRRHMALYEAAQWVLAQPEPVL